MNSVLGVIPARWASSRFPGKPLHLLAGKPLLWHTWQQARKATTLDQLLIATDDPRIFDAARTFGAEVVMTRPDHPSGTDRIAEVAAQFPDATCIVNIQGDEPRMPPETIDQLVHLLHAHPTCGIATAANPLPPNADPANSNIVKVVHTPDLRALYFSRAPIPHQRDPGPRSTPFLQHQGIYAYRRSTLLQFVAWPPSPLEISECLEQLRALEHGVEIRLLLTSSPTHGVDTPNDARMIEANLI